MRRPQRLVTGINYAPEQTGSAVQTAGVADMIRDPEWHVAGIKAIPDHRSRLGDSRLAHTDRELGLELGGLTRHASPRATGVQNVRPSGRATR